MLEWDDKYSVGISVINEEHKKFIDIINKAARVQKYDNNSRGITDVLIEMTSYAQEHFRTEENYMTSFEYSDYESHKDEHKNFSEIISSYCNKLMHGDLAIVDEVFEHLKQYLIDHIQGIDRKYIDCFKRNGL